MTLELSQPIRPCFFMRGLLSASCDDALEGLTRRFAEWHVAHCPRCAAALAALRTLHARLRALVSPMTDAADAHLPPERWARLEAAWAEADRQT